MFGCELPVAAMSFHALPELVIDGENGLVFNSSEQLAEVFHSQNDTNCRKGDICISLLLQILVSWFQDFAGFLGTSSHKAFRRNLAQFRELGWKENWNKVIIPLLPIKYYYTMRVFLMNPPTPPKKCPPFKEILKLVLPKNDHGKEN